MNTEFTLYDEIMDFESISIINVQYEPDVFSVFYDDDIVNFANSSISQVDPSDYLCVSFLSLDGSH